MKNLNVVTRAVQTFVAVRKKGVSVSAALVLAVVVGAYTFATDEQLLNTPPEYGVSPAASAASGID